MEFAGALLDDCRTGRGHEGIVDFPWELAFEVKDLTDLTVQLVKLTEATAQTVAQIHCAHLHFVTLPSRIVTANSRFS